MKRHFQVSFVPFFSEEVSITKTFDFSYLLALLNELNESTSRTRSNFPLIFNFKTSLFLRSTLSVMLLLSKEQK